MASYFTNFGHQLYNKALNNIDPKLQLQYQNQLNETVPNPFYHYLTRPSCQGRCTTSRRFRWARCWCPIRSIPALAEFGHCCAGERYNSLELRAQKVFSKGYNFLFSYVYIRERSQIYFNDHGHVHQQPDVAG